MFKRLKEFLKKKRKESQNNQAAYWDDEIDEELDYDWDEESSEDEDDVYGDYGRCATCSATSLKR